MKKDEDIIKIIVDEDDGGKSASGVRRLTGFFKGLADNVQPAFIRISLAVCAAVIAASLLAGFLVPKSEKTVSRSLASLKQTDKDYLRVKQSSDDARVETERLEERIEENTKNIEKFNDYQDNLDKITQKINDLKKEKEALEAQVKEKRSELDSLSVSLNAKSKKTVTLTSGRYETGVNIAEGKYSVTGSGSIVISSGGSARVNKALKSDGEAFTISNGDIIDIDGSAKFIPE